MRKQITAAFSFFLLAIPAALQAQDQAIDLTLIRWPYT